MKFKKKLQMKMKSLPQASKTFQITDQNNQNIRLENWEISIMSNSSSGNDSDYDEQGTGTGIGTRKGESNASGSRTSETPTSTISSQNEIPDCSNLCPPRALHEYAKGTFNPKTPFFFMRAKYLEFSPNQHKNKGSITSLGMQYFWPSLGRDLQSG